MKNLKKGAATLLAIGMTMSMAMPAMAQVTRVNTFADGSRYVETDNYKKYENFPCWIWVDNYCYYFDNNGVVFKNGTTPDGWTVDAEGRWTIDGVPQTNGLGSAKMNTEEYNSMNKDQIWQAMKSKLIPVYENAIPFAFTRDVMSADGDEMLHFDGYTYVDAPNQLRFDFDTSLSGPGTIYINKNENNPNEFITAGISHAWHDMIDKTSSAQSKAAYANAPYTTEKTIKALLGDHVGQEFFDDMKRASDPLGEGGWRPVRRADGSLIIGYYADRYMDGEFKTVFVENPKGRDYKTELVAESGDGFNKNLLDLSKWQNRTTDYGMRFSVTCDSHLQIHIYN